MESGEVEEMAQCVVEEDVVVEVRCNGDEAETAARRCASIEALTAAAYGPRRTKREAWLRPCDLPPTLRE